MPIVPAVLADAARIEVAIVPNCAAQPASGPVFGDPIIRFAPGENAPPLGEVPTGDQGLFARLINAECEVIASGCAPVSLNRGAGPLRVSVATAAGPACGFGESCNAGSCRTAQVDGGTSDINSPVDAGDNVDANRDTGSADADGVVDGGVDSGPDAGPTCNPCAEGVPIVPGGVGPGTCTQAAYRCTSTPRVVRVTNLDDSGEGSLRRALATVGGAIIVFDVSGVFTPETRLIGETCQIVAGQTAPGPVVIRGALNYADASDVLVQHLTILADEAVSPYALNVQDLDNVVFDHLTLAYGTSVSARLFRVTNTAVMNSMVGVPLGDACASTSGLGSVGWVGNLFGLCRQYTPSTEAFSFIANNVTYGTSFRQTWLTTRSTDVALDATVVDNLFLTSGELGRATIHAIRGDDTEWVPSSRVYTAGNYWDAEPGAPETVVAGLPPKSVVDTPPVVAECYEGLAADLPTGTLLQAVSAHVGARASERTEFELWFINHLGARTGTLVNTLDETPGYPALTLVELPRALPDNPHDDDDDNGYTNIQEWLHQLAQDVQ